MASALSCAGTAAVLPFKDSPETKVVYAINRVRLFADVLRKLLGRGPGSDRWSRTCAGCSPRHWSHTLLDDFTRDWRNGSGDWTIGGFWNFVEQPGGESQSFQFLFNAPDLLVKTIDLGLSLANQFVDVLHG